MSKLSQVEANAVDTACARLRETELGTHVKSVEEFLNEAKLETDANTVSEAINELYRMIVNKDCSAIQVPPPGFFTLWGNDEDGKLYCYYNDEDHPPVFRHVEDESADDFGSLYLYIADPDGDNHYELLVGEYIAVKHLENYFTKSEINSMFSTLRSDIGRDIAELDDKIATKANRVHTHVKSDITDLIIPSKTSELTNDSGYLTNSNLTGYATINYVDQKIVDNVSGTIDLDSYVTKEELVEIFDELANYIES